MIVNGADCPEGVSNMSAPNPNNATKRPQAPVITANETDERGALPLSPVVATPLGPHIKGRYMRVANDPTNPLDIIVELAVWHVLDGVYSGANTQAVMLRAEAGDKDSVTGVQNTMVGTINSALAEI